MGARGGGRAGGVTRSLLVRHQILGPVTSTGGMKTLPGVREAIEQRRWTEAAEQIGVAARAIEAFAREVERGAGLLAAGG